MVRMVMDVAILAKDLRQVPSWYSINIVPVVIRRKVVLRRRNL